MFYKDESPYLRIKSDVFTTIKMTNTRTYDTKIYNITTTLMFFRQI